MKNENEFRAEVFRRANSEKIRLKKNRKNAVLAIILAAALIPSGLLAARTLGTRLRTADPTAADKVEEEFPENSPEMFPAGEMENATAAAPTRTEAPTESAAGAPTADVPQEEQLDSELTARLLEFLRPFEEENGVTLNPAAASVSRNSLTYALSHWAPGMEQITPDGDLRIYVRFAGEKRELTEDDVKRALIVTINDIEETAELLGVDRVGMDEFIDYIPVVFEFSTGEFYIMNYYKLYNVNTGRIYRLDPVSNARMEAFRLGSLQEREAGK